VGDAQDSAPGNQRLPAPGTINSSETLSADVSHVEVPHSPIAQVVGVVQRIETHSGPIPTARSLSEYRDLDPDLYEAIVHSFKENDAHSRRVEDAQLDIARTAIDAMRDDDARTHASRQLALTYGFLWNMTLVLFAGWAAAQGQPPVAIAALAATGLPALSKTVSGWFRREESA